VTRRALTIQPAHAVRGTLEVPGDKSISHRAALFAALAEGTTTITGLSSGADVAATLACLRALAVDVAHDDGVLAIHGHGPDAWRAPAAALDAGNSGTTMRLLAGALAGRPFISRIGGDASLSRRPMQRVIDPLTAMGATIISQDGRPPLEIHGGRLTGIEWRSPVASAQIKSAVLLAGLSASGQTTVREPLRSRDHTERLLPVFGVTLTHLADGVSLVGGQRLRAPEAPLDVPGDPSAAAVWAAAAAALPGSAIRIRRVGLNPTRLGFVDALRRMGALVTLEQDGQGPGEPSGSLTVVTGERRPVEIGATDVPSLIDELPVLAAAAALGGHLEVTGAAELRVKESDRISALVEGFRALGVTCDERPDGFVIDGARRPRGGAVDARDDHRLVMAFALVGLGATGPTTIEGAEVVAVSYPAFQADLAALTGS
jgi:3-phosphoshikimate 1-carboxyvinyltransferase